MDTTSDPSNCGTCGKICPTGGSCSAGTCTCPSGQTACGGKCVNTNTDPANCGSCGVACTGGKTCSAGTCSCGASVSFGTQVWPLFSGCTGAGCHGGIKPAEGLDLSSTTTAWNGLVGVASTTCAGKIRVVASSVPSSYLINKLDGTFTSLGCVGSRMPKGGPYLTTTQMDTIKAWICEGAPK